jgi:hypothetical protein
MPRSSWQADRMSPLLVREVAFSEGDKGIDVRLGGGELSRAPFSVGTGTRREFLV